jgi:hypothetical protein
MTDLAIRVEGLTKRFDTVTALGGIDLEIPSRAIAPVAITPCVAAATPPFRNQTVFAMTQKGLAKLGIPANRGNLRTAADPNTCSTGRRSRCN